MVLTVEKKRPAFVLTPDALCPARGEGRRRRWLSSLFVLCLWGVSGCLEESPADLEGLSREGSRTAGPVNPVPQPSDPAGSPGTASAPTGGNSPGGSGALPAGPAAPSSAAGTGAAQTSAAPGNPAPGSNAAPPGPPSGASGNTTSGRPTISEDHSDSPRKSQEELQSASATLTLSGTIECSLCKGNVLINVVDSQGLLTRKVQAPGKYSLTVPEGAGAVTLTVIADQNGNGQPSKGEPLGFLSGGGLTLEQKDLAGLDITIQ